MLSRSAQGLYWMGRYLERAEHLCRLLRLQTEALVDRPVREIYFGWKRIYGSMYRQPPLGECLLPGLGWTEFDPTNPDLSNEHLVRVAVGRDYHDVAPTRGVFVGESDSLLEVSVRMRPTQ